MKKRLFAALLCALLLMMLMPGAVWSAPDEGPDTPASEPEPGPEDEPEHIHDHLTYVPAQEASCTAPGCTAHYECSCGLWFQDASAAILIADHSSVILPQLEHTPETFLGTAATCTEPGVTAGIRCTVCGAVLNGMEPIPMKGHSPAEAWSSDASGHWHECANGCGTRLDFEAHVSGGAATATRPETCTVCGYVIKPATGTTYTPTPTPGQTVHPTPRPTPTPEPSPSPTPEPSPGALLSSRVSFSDTGDTAMEDLVLEQPDAQTELCTVTLPEEKPVSAGWYFEGWRSGEDGRLYQPGDEISFRYADTPRLRMTAEWTVLIGRGNYDLSAGMRYRFDEGTYQIDGDSTVYYGGSAFYVREGGNFTIR